MFTVQFELPNGTHKLQSVDVRSRSKLLTVLARFDYPIMAVYEQASPITKVMRSDLRTWPGTLSLHAREFAFAMSPA